MNVWVNRKSTELQDTKTNRLSNRWKNKTNPGKLLLTAYKKPRLNK